MSHTTKKDSVGHEDGSVTWTEVTTEPGEVWTRLVHAFPATVERTNCFCCSCTEDYYSGMRSMDAFCRNHGNDFGRRPCDIHDLPGEAIDRDALGSYDDMLAGRIFIGPEPMPEPVTVYRRKYDNTPEIP